MRRATLALALALAVVGTPVGCKSGSKEPAARGATAKNANPYPDTATLKRAMDDKRVIVVDVRTDGEWQRGHIPGARHLPLSQLRKRAQELPKDKDLVLYCAVGSRSGRALKILQRLGYPRVFNFGGLSDWKGKIAK